MPANIGASTAANAFVRARVSAELRDDAAAVLDTLGLTISDVVRMTLTRIARDKGLPPGLTAPNAETRAALEEAEAMRHAGNLRFGRGEDLLNVLEENAR